MAITGLGFDLETVSCPLCGSDRYDIYLSRAKELYNGLNAWFDVVRCRQCGFVFTNPRPTEATIGCFYPDTAQYYQPKTNRAKSGNWSNKPWKRVLQQSVLTSRFGYPLRQASPLLAALSTLVWCKRLRLAHLPQFVPGGRLLDIGCSWGGYLWRMQELGWDVHGIELNTEAARFAREDLGMTNIRTGSFADLDYPDGSFDVVHMSMVLEHLYNPGDALLRVNRLLRVGGQFILSVPDISGFEARIFKDKCYTLQVPQHLSHFSPETLTRFLQKTGFVLEEIIHQRVKRDFTQSAEYLENKALARLLNFPLVRGVVLGPLTGVLAALGKTSRMSVFARKEGPL